MVPQEIQRRIDKLARRSRRLVIFSGLGVVALCMAAVILVTFTADYLLRLPPGMRALSLAALLLVTAGAALRTLWLPLRRTPTTDELALKMEASFPELRDSLISAVQLSRQMESDEFYQSRDLARAVVAVGGDKVRDLNIARAAPGGRTYKIFGSAMGVFGLLALLAIWSPYHASTWFLRICLLQGVEWQRNVILVVEGIPPEGATVVRGEDFTVRVGVRRGRPEEVLIHSRAESRSRWEVRPMVRHLKEGEGWESYVRAFREIPEDFRFFVTGGDARTREFPVSVMVPPTIQKVHLTVSYPAYLGRSDENVPDGNLRAPYGSRVTFRAEASRSLSKAALVMGETGGGAL